MKLQQLIYKVEELKALVSLYEQTQQGLAQAAMLQETLMEDTDQETRGKVDDTVQTLQARLDSVDKLLLERTGARDTDAAVEAIHSHIVRLQQFQQIRGEQLQLRTQLDLELAMGVVQPETRQAAEDGLQQMQNRLETLVRQGYDALPGSRILTLS